MDRDGNGPVNGPALVTSDPDLWAVNIAMVHSKIGLDGSVRNVNGRVLSRTGLVNLTFQEQKCAFLSPNNMKKVQK